MSGPYCKTCKHFHQMPLSYVGECTDPSKRIYAKGGEVMNQYPSVSPGFSCDNHEPEQSEQEQSDE